MNRLLPAVLISGVIAGSSVAQPAYAGDAGRQVFHDGVTAAALSPDAVWLRIAAADILLLGEIHDNPHHHAGQAQAMDRLFAAAPRTTAPPAVVFEMLDRGQRDSLDAYAGTAEDFGAAMGWMARGWPDPALYAPVFEAAFAVRARIVAGGLRKSDLRGLYDAGPEILPPEIRRLYDLLEPMDQARLDDMAEIQFQAHCELMPRARMAGMVTVQRARDAALAEAVVDAYRRAPDAPVVLIAGAGHVRLDHGVGALLRRALPEADILVIGFAEASSMNLLDWNGTARPEFDIVWTTPGVDRPDPCDSLRARMKP